MNNNVNLIGNLGQDVNMITFKTGNKKASVSLATSSYYKNAKGEMQKETQWHNLIAWGLQAEMMSKALKKGSMILVKGSLQYRDYQDKAGKDIKVTEVVVEDFIVFQNRKSENSKSENHFEAVAEALLPF